MNLFMVYTKMLTSTIFWILSTVIIVASLLPDFSFRAFTTINIGVGSIFPGNARMGTKKRKIAPLTHETTYL
jgi:hypothetical protein